MPAVRPTPADPTPGVRTAAREAGNQRALPPELGPGSLAVLSGPTFMYSDQSGDVPPGSIGGLVHLDTRLLSGWVLTVNGARLLVLRSETIDHYSAQYVLTNPELPGLPPDSLGIRRLRYVGDGFNERVEMFSFRPEPVRVQLRLAVDADFADLFEVKSVVQDRSARITRAHQPGELCFSYAGDGFDAQTRVRCSVPADRLDGDELVWDFTLEPREGWKVDLYVPLRPGLGVVEPVRGDIADVIHRRADDPLRRWTAGRAVLTSDSQALERIARRSRDDVAALRLDLEVKGQRIMLPGAGLPWFLAVFGRDTLITAYQTLVAGPALAKGALLGLARLQGNECDDFTDEEPGKILHEVRSGELTRTGVKPYGPYYGTADATQLWLVLLSSTGGGRATTRPFGSCATTRWPRCAGSTSTAIGTATATSSTPPAHRRGWATSAGGTRRTGSASPTGASPCCRWPPVTCRATRTTPRCGWRSWPTGRWPIRAWPVGCAPRPRPCTSGSTGTSGSPSGAATTRWAWTATRTGSTPRPRTWVTCCGAASSRPIARRRWCAS